MGKHNGRARKTGLPVGRTLENATKKKFQPRENVVRSQQSVLEQDGIDNFVAMAELAGKEIAAEHSRTIVLESGLKSLHREPTQAEMLDLEKRFGHLVKIPRRPSWTADQSPEDLDRNEKESFLNWRRQVAHLQEGNYGVLLTPYEKNLEVWRQLWRVLERSNILVQVVDARDPLFYYSEDLVNYAKELNAATETLVLLNKADLVNAETRQKWANYFKAEQIRYAFWSAKRATVDDKPEDLIEGEQHNDVRIQGPEQIIQLLEMLARQATKTPESPSVVGLVGYPNVGKSSTINALFGKKKTPVAQTPGRTKHFQTLFVSESLCLCDCPGLVLPAFARSKAEMTVAGVMPVDKLTDVLSPLGIILSRIGLDQFCKLYGLAKESIETIRTTSDSTSKVIATLATSRGWTQAAGLPDLTKTGRQVIKDYLNGKLLHCALPPGSSQTLKSDSWRISDTLQDTRSLRLDDQNSREDDDQMMMECCPPGDISSDTESRPRRPAYKFHKKPSRTKGNRGRQYNADTPISSSVKVKGQRGSLTGGLL